MCVCVCVCVCVCSLWGAVTLRAGPDPDFLPLGRLMLARGRDGSTLRTACLGFRCAVGTTHLVKPGFASRLASVHSMEVVVDSRSLLGTSASLGQHVMELHFSMHWTILLSSAARVRSVFVQRNLMQKDSLPRCLADSRMEHNIITKAEAK